MYKQMRKFITSGIIAVTLLLMVTANANSHYMYEWEGQEGYINDNTSGQLELDCEVWTEDNIASWDEVTGFYFNGLNGTEYTDTEVTTFMIALGLSGTISATDTSGDTLSMAIGFPTADSWVVSDVWERVGQSIYVYGGAWNLVQAHDDCNPVPEPTTVALLGIGLVGLIGGAARKKLKKKAIAKT